MILPLLLFVTHSEIAEDPNDQDRPWDWQWREKIDEEKDQLRSLRRRRRPGANLRLDAEASSLSDSPEFKCDKPHTRRNLYHRCVCEVGYVGNFPSESGCWKCNETCAPSAACISPGVCLCDHGYFGDGLVCTVVTPELVRLSPTKCPFRDCILNATFGNPGDVSYGGYCHFNEKVSVQAELRDGSMICRVPALDPGKVLVTLSFDREHQSNVSLLLRIQGQPWDEQSLGVMALLVVTAIVLGIALMKKIGERNLFKDSRPRSLVSKAAARRGFL
jgi:hypothetical protein